MITCHACAAFQGCRAERTPTCFAEFAALLAHRTRPGRAGTRPEAPRPEPWPASAGQRELGA